jgi:hypothetical protein
MNEKPVKLPMDFGEALARLARTPKKAIDAAAARIERKDAGAKASEGPPRSGRRKTA